MTRSSLHLCRLSPIRIIICSELLPSTLLDIWVWSVNATFNTDDTETLDSVCPTVVKSWTKRPGIRSDEEQAMSHGVSDYRSMYISRVGRSLDYNVQGDVRELRL